ncbi:hypothetical protein QOZ80_6BG0470900 [Eleusine coracana subsp. coracana]|nr:hypothetical protein QOZ80_6BG0470900 [Eleusine coracana subsp. coracana]
MAVAARWVLLCRFIPALGRDDAEAAEPAADFSVALRSPPRVTFLTAARRVHPNPNYIDPDAYVLAADRSAVLFRFATSRSAAPTVDRDLVVARHFLPAASGGHQRAVTSTAFAYRVPRRTAPMPVIYALAFIGLVSLHGSDRYGIAELQLDGTSGNAKLFTFFETDGAWLERDVILPVAAQGRHFASVGVVPHDGEHLWLLDLSWGLLSCNPLAIEPVLRFHDLPPGRAVPRYYQALHDERCVCESKHKLRFAEIVRGHDSHGRETASVVMWTRIPAADGSGETDHWKNKYEISFAEIWNHDSYKATQLPPKVPAIVLVSPNDPKLVYFFLEDRLFGVNVPEHRVVHFVTEQLPGEPNPPTEPASHVRVLPWILPPSISHGNT